MSKKVILATIIAGIIVFIIIISVNTLTLNNSKPPESRLDVIASNLEVPWSMEIHDGKVYFTERVGRVNLIENGIVKTLFTKKVANVGEGGMLGLALDPEFDKNGYIYIYYTYSEGGRLWNRVSRLDNVNGTYKESLILIDKIPGNVIHNGGRIKFGPDGRLYITTGDANHPELAQDLGSLAGKILRIEKDGSIPKDNPFPNSPIYSYGHRNPQGLAWNKLKQLYASEHGPIGNDEINLIVAGKNYGWPEEQCKGSKYESAIFCYNVSVAPSGITIYNNTLYIAMLRGERVESLNLDSMKNEVFITGLGRVRDLVLDGNYLYIATSNKDGRGNPKVDDDKILRVVIR